MKHLKGQRSHQRILSGWWHNPIVFWKDQHTAEKWEQTGSRIFLMAFVPFLNFVFLKKCMLKETQSQKRGRNLSEKVLEESVRGTAHSLSFMHLLDGM